MSPVSRGRKTKKSSKGTQPGRRATAAHPRVTPVPAGQARSALTALAQTLGGPPQRPGWFGESIDAVLDGAGVLMPAQGPRELEDTAARLLGAEQQRRLHAHESGFWFDWWFADLADAAMMRARAAIDGADPDAWQSYWRLLHAMTGLGSPTLARAAHVRLGRVTKALPRDLAAAQPPWLRLLPKITATGQLWQMHDGYGGRTAVIAGFAYPGGADPSVFLFDIDACGFTTLAGAGSYDDVEQAAAAWRASVGHTADGTVPVPVDTPESLHAMVHWDDGEETLRGDEPRTVLDNWFRARRRLHDLAETLRKRRTPLPAWRNLYRDVDAEPSIEAFTTWYTQRHGTAPDPDAVAALAYEWLEGALPGTERVVAPARITFIRTLMSDWLSDDPVTVGAKTLLLDWIRWNGEQDHLPAHLLDPGIAAATATTVPAARHPADEPDQAP
jgi:hypothetical protein